MKPKPIATTIAELDLILAEEALVGGLKGQRLFAVREARDAYWIIACLGCRGVHLVEADVRACLEGRPGRFLPDQLEYVLIRGLRAAIDKIDDWASLGHRPTPESILVIQEIFRFGAPRGEQGEARGGTPAPFHLALASSDGVTAKSYPYAAHPAILKIFCAKRALNLVRLAIG